MRPLQGAVERFYLLVSRVNPLLYMLGYLICVPTFAGFYCSLDDGFYAPYAQLEPAGQRDQREILAMVDDKLWNYFNCIDEEVGSAGFVSGASRFHPKELIASKLEIDRGYLTFDVHLLLFAPRTPDEFEHLTIPIRPPAKSFTIPMRIGPAGMNPTRIELNRYKLDLLQPNPQTLDPSIRDFMERSSPACERKLSDFEEGTPAQLINYIAGRNNNPLKVSGEKARMIYFSVVVITTLGFGDIVPMTPFARMLVAIEAILGTVLLGLMFNAIAYRASNRAASAATLDGAKL
ncbi:MULTISPECIES: potassium channel family protein [unclassified Bradyrhizobium]|uniref:potassium channel family protein n=1 Tax=unclassified Bradyrhizobium TaxID=2631580 RepID=UPI002916718E|nr:MULTISPECIES: potassium channel family protein [unclassified Bradyrhizobium]